jgi:putative membrane protein insertion efficiency factor
MRLLRLVWQLPGLILIGLVRGYQYAISPILQHVAGAQCRFTPSCSEYFIQAVKKYGAVSGAARGVWRVCRCNPFCKGGDDPP